MLFVVANVSLLGLFVLKRGHMFELFVLKRGRCLSNLVIFEGTAAAATAKLNTYENVNDTWTW